MAASTESQERWDRWYQAVSDKRGGHEKAMIANMMHRRLWGTVLMACSGLFVVGLTTVFYRVLTR
ncbi:MAG: hypothetical protein JWM82_2567 [Myxococcales bacterium]|jgi:hypothetical protein|nr:hypothetical protein [Myxococcales bacterium]